MKRCVNFREGCRGLTERHLHYCTDCYASWHAGGAAQVSEDIAVRNKPAHVCVGTEQLAAKDAEIAKLTTELAELTTQYSLLQSKYRGVAQAVDRMLEIVRLSARPQHAKDLSLDDALEIIQTRLRGYHVGRVHPTAAVPPVPSTERQLDRIESLAKQAASRSVFWPCLVAVIIYAVLFG